MRARRWIPGFDARPVGTRETVVLTALAALLLAGCASSRRGGGSLLSEASREAARSSHHRHEGDQDHGRDHDTPKKRKVLHAAPEVRRHREPAPVVVVVEDDGYADDGPRYDTRREPAGPPTTYFLRLSGGGGGSDRPELDAWNCVSVEGGAVVPGSDGRIQAGVDLGAAPIRKNGYAAAGLTDPLELTAGVNLRYYTGPPRSGPRPYALLGFRAGLLHWDYASTLPIEDEWGNVNWVGDDFVNSWTPYVGAGVDLFTAGQTSVGASVAAGMKVFSPYTNEGLRNDLFKDAGYVEMRIDVAWLSR